MSLAILRSPQECSSCLFTSFACFFRLHPLFVSFVHDIYVCVLCLFASFPTFVSQAFSPPRPLCTNNIYKGDSHKDI
mgnify:FL=1